MINITKDEARKYGYYVLPIIYKEKFIGRCEPIMDPKNEELIIKNWVREMLEDKKIELYLDTSVPTLKLSSYVKSRCCDVFLKG